MGALVVGACWLQLHGAAKAYMAAIAAAVSGCLVFMGVQGGPTDGRAAGEPQGWGPYLTLTQPQVAITQTSYSRLSLLGEFPIFHAQQTLFKTPRHRLRPVCGFKFL